MQIAVKSGRYQSAEEAIRDAITRWEEDERSRAEMVAALDESTDDLEASRYRDYTDSTLSLLTQELKTEGRAFRATKRPTSA